jgi:hypothetical protein
VQPRLSAQLGSLVVSAVRHVFAPDIRYRTVDYAEKLIVPLIALRNHRRFDPLSQVGGKETLQPGEPLLSGRACWTVFHASLHTAGAAGPVNDFRIDMQVLRDQLQRMLLPSQRLFVVPAVHGISEHRHIATAVFKALRQDTIHTAGDDGSGIRYPEHGTCC